MDFKKILLSTLVLFTTGIATAKDGYNIKIKATNLHDSVIYMCHYFGKGGTVYKDDSALVKGKSTAEFTYKSDKKIVGGIYMLLFSSNNSNFEFLLENGNDFGINLDRDDAIKSTKFTNNLENTHFYEYQNYLLGISERYNKISAELAGAKTKKDSTKINEKSKALSTEMNNYRRDYCKKNPASMASSIFNAIEEPEVPTVIPNLPDGKKDSTYAYHFYKDNYWNKFNFKDDRIIYSPLYDRKLEEYYKLIPPIPDSVNKETDMLLSKTRGTTELFKYTLWWATRYAETSKVMGMDQSFVYLVENYYMKGDAKWLEDSSLNKYIDRAKKIAPNMIGQTAPDVRIPDDKENMTALSAYYPKNDYTLLIFWSADCGHCQKEMPQLDSTLRVMRKKVNIKGFAVESDNEEDKWHKFIVDKNLGDFWLHAHDPKHTSNFRSDYDVYMTPVIYLLDNTGKIVGKKLDHSNLEGLVNFLEKKKKEGSKKK